eukprot:7017420-Alexandrium_andersonii.AAC.1
MLQGCAQGQGFHAGQGIHVCILSQCMEGMVVVHGDGQRSVGAGREYGRGRRRRPQGDSDPGGVT